MDADDLELFERTVRSVAAGADGPLDDALADLGWTDALADDPRAAVSVLFGAQGEANATSAALALLLLSALGLDEADAGMVLPAIGSWDPPGAGGGEDVSVEGLATAALGSTETAIVIARHGANVADMVAVSVPTAALELRTIEGADPSLGLVAVTGHGIGATTETLIDPDRWDRAIALGRRALAHELIGASTAMLNLARDHALSRVQFGRTISSHQAIRHRLAESLVAIETAEAMVDAAWLDGTPATAAMAKAVAGRESRTVARHCQQVLAGIGFTTEHPLHLYIRRRLVLDALLGSATTITRTQGETIIASRSLPPPLPL